MTLPVVVKFGGSLLAAPERDALLAVAAREGVIVAPGGGPFADAVREDQRRDAFGDDVAHRRAILAMDRMAEALGQAAPDLQIAETLEQLRDHAAARTGAVWRPSPLALRADVPASWDVTSDSLALWLAIELGAARLILLKAATVPGGGSPASWADAGLIDSYFPTLARRFSGEILCVGPATPQALERALAASLKAAA